MAFELFMNKQDHVTTLEKISRIFKTSPGLERTGREGPSRKKTSNLQSYNFQKRNRKHVF
jgi:hypothetical protein